MSFPLRIPDQLKQHLRALRKSRGLTQAKLGALVGVKQARIAEIEANPGAVSLDQLTKVLASMGATLYLHSADAAGIEKSEMTAAARAAPAKKRPGPSRPRAVESLGTSTAERRPKGGAKPAPTTGVVIRPKKGTW